MSSNTVESATEIRPLQVEVPEEQLDDLRRRIAATRWPDPAAVTVFPRELYQAPRSWAEQAYPNLIYFNEVDKVGHFAAWEQPQLFAEEIRAAFRSLRSQRRSS
jgi:pimeloyl-ACP methyl ester carboxylesterase